MNEKKWLVINLRTPTDLSMREDILVKTFEEIISTFRDKVESWHFLWEPEPYPHTLLLRFYGVSETIDELEEALERFLDEEGIEYNQDTTYDGEAERYGTKGWEYVMRILHLGADFAMDLIKKERSRSNSEEFSQPFFLYIDRWIYLFLNQLLTRRVVEHDVLFRFSVHRYVISKIGGRNYRQVSGDLARETPRFFDLFKEEIDDFLRDKGYNV